MPDTLQKQTLEHKWQESAIRRDVLNPKSKTHFNLLEYTWAALSQDPEDPLSAVSVANSSFSIDTVVGCAWQCAYCHVQGSKVNLGADGEMPRRARVLPRSFGVSQIVEAMISHPAFEANKSIVSIGTSSTEPFAPQVLTNTFSVIKAIQDAGLENPIWIVTKAGMSDDVIASLSKAVNRGNEFVISLTHGGLGREIEPVQNHRFRNAEAAYNLGIKLVVYLRPIVESWGSTRQRLREILIEAKTEIGSGAYAAVAPGGLRWTEGIEYGLQVRNLAWPDELEKTHNAKDMPDELWQYVSDLCDEIFPDTPFVKHSSCSLSNALGKPDIAMVYSKKKSDCSASKCPKYQFDRCMAAKSMEVRLEEQINVKVEKMCLDIGATPSFRDTLNEDDSRAYIIDTLRSQVRARVLEEFLNET